MVKTVWIRQLIMGVTHFYFKLFGSIIIVVAPASTTPNMDAPDNYQQTKIVVFYSLQSLHWWRANKCQILWLCVSYLTQYSWHFLSSSLSYQHWINNYQGLWVSYNPVWRGFHVSIVCVHAGCTPRIAGLFWSLISHHFETFSAFWLCGYRLRQDCPQATQSAAV